MLIILGDSLEQVAVIDNEYSLVWIERWDEIGEFEAELPIDWVYTNYLFTNYYVIIPESDRVMIIEDINKKHDAELGDKVVIKGNSAEGMLQWRVTEDIFYLDGNVQTGILQLLNDNLISATNTKRNISVFTYSSNPGITSPAYDIQDMYKAGYVSKIVQELCRQLKLGFKVTLNQVTRVLVFELVIPVNKSHTQSTNPIVTFSEDFDNVISSDYYVGLRNWKNVSQVITDDVDTSLQRVMTWTVQTEPANQFRHETVIEMQSPRDAPGGPVLTVSEALEIIKNKGKEDLKDKKPYGVLDGEFYVQGVYKYNQDFFLGDIVRCVINDLNVSARVIERIFSMNDGEVTDFIAFDFYHDSY